MNNKSRPVTEALVKIIQMLMEERFWGQIVIKFKEGEPIIIQKEQQIKLK